MKCASICCFAEMIKIKLTCFIYCCIIPLIGLIFIRVISLTYKITIFNSERGSRFSLNKIKKNAIIYASFHQRFLPGITTFTKKKPIAAIISKSKDGEIISRVLSMLGWFSIRGSSSKGGREALIKAVSLIRLGYNIVHAVDGPRGPFGKIKPGIIRIAQLAGAPIVPVIMSFEKYWIFNKSWDRFMLPKPFSRVLLQFAEPQKVPSYMNKHEFEKRRTLLQKKMEKEYKKLDLFWKTTIAK